METTILGFIGCWVEGHFPSRFIGSVSGSEWDAAADCGSDKVAGDDPVVLVFLTQPVEKFRV